MKKQILSALLALLLVFLMTPVLNAEITTPISSNLNDYNPHDYEKLAAFLEQEDDNGVKNGAKLSESYDVNDPSTWGEAFTWVEIENEEEQGLRLYLFEAYSAGLVGQLDLSGCDRLVSINCAYNEISEVNTAGETDLQQLIVDGMQIRSLDVSENTALGNLSCGDCMLEELDLTNNPQLMMLNCEFNNIRSLDVSQCRMLMMLVCRYNELSELDLSNNTWLRMVVDVEANHLAELDVSMCPQLQILRFRYNDLTEIDLSNNSQLTSLWCTGNRLTSLDISNMPSLRDLDCRNNQIAGKLDVTNCPSMDTLWCSGNHISDIDVTACSNLTLLNCSDNELTSIDISMNTRIDTFVCADNEITSLDVSNNPDLIRFDCSRNALRELDLSDNPLLLPYSVEAENGGKIGYQKDIDNYDSAEPNMIELLYAYPEEGYEFLGWFDEEGTLLSTDGEYLISFAPFPGWDNIEPVEEKHSYIARFEYVGASTLPGDVNFDGAVQVEDAILAMRSAMGILDLSAEQILAGDMNGDGAIHIDDAIIILRKAMELLD